MDEDDLTAAIHALADCDHFDRARRGARALPADFPILDLLRAADGATRLARELDIQRRIAS